MAKQIPLQNGMFAIVDDEDYERCMEHIWSVVVSRRTTLSVKKEFDGKVEMLGWFILNLKLNDSIITFRDGDRLNFKKDNLVILPKSAKNHITRGQRGSLSKYKGVSYESTRRKFRATITHHGNHIFLGRFESEAEAAKAYNIAALKYFGEHAYQNVLGTDNNATEIKTKKVLKVRRKTSTTSNYRGVYWDGRKKKWLTQLKGSHIGRFEKEIEAAKAYDKKAKEIYGNKAILNFPNGSDSSEGGEKDE